MFDLIATRGKRLGVPSYQNCMPLYFSLCFFRIDALPQKRNMFIPVLAARYPVQVNNQLKTMITSPNHCVAEVSELALDIRFARADLPGPVPDRQPHVVQAEEINSSRT